MPTEMVVETAGAPELLPGAEIGGCRVIKLLGHGGMGQVYLVENIQMHKKYALKILSAKLAADPSFIDRFRIEARVMADLNHPNIVHVNHIGEDKGSYYILMDYIAGTDGEPETLEDRLKRCGKLSENESSELLHQLCDALDYAHNFRDGGVIHRDLKPSNILINSDGNPVIADFGLVKIAGTEYLKSMIEHSMRLTMGGGLRYSPDISIGEMKTIAHGDSNSSTAAGTAGALIGTYEYMAPEQQEGQEATIQSDIYSLGMILYYCLTGRKPKGRWKLPSQLGLDNKWDGIVEKALEPELQDRFLYVIDLKHQLQPSSARPPRRLNNNKVEEAKSESKWWYDNGSGDEIEVTESKLNKLILDGKIAPETEVWREGADEWISAKDSVELCEIFINKNKADTKLMESETLKRLWLERDKGNSDAIYELGMLYFDGKTVEQDYSKAFELFLQSAEMKHEKAQFMVGKCYMRGVGISENSVKGVKWFKMSADQGNSYAQNVLGECYLNGNGVRKNRPKASGWFIKAVKQGDIRAKFNLGICYYNGFGVTKNRKEALNYYIEAAKEGLPDAQFALAECYEHGSGCNKDKPEAFIWYSKAAEQDFPDAIFKLGLCYYYGRGVRKNRKEALVLFTETANLGMPQAQYFLGMCYYHGHGVKRDLKIAIKNLKEASKQDYAKAQYFLGECYYYGFGVTSNQQTAKSYYEKAFANGSGRAWDRLRELSPQPQYTYTPQRQTKSKSSFCFLTTAVCETLNRCDDCYELNLLRYFRDNYMCKNTELNKEVEEYYMIAPVIVDVVNARADAKKIWSDLAKRYIMPCIRLIEAGKNIETYSLYKKMFLELKEKYIDKKTTNKETV